VWAFRRAIRYRDGVDTGLHLLGGVLRYTTQHVSPPAEPSPPGRPFSAQSGCCAVCGEVFCCLCCILSHWFDIQDRSIMYERQAISFTIRPPDATYFIFKGCRAQSQKPLPRNYDLLKMIVNYQWGSVAWGLGPDAQGCCTLCLSGGVVVGGGVSVKITVNVVSKYHVVAPGSLKR